MLSRCHIEAALPDPCYIFGARLLPFCIGHYYIIESDVPNLLEGGNVEAREFIFAVAICSMSFEDGCDYRAGNIGNSGKWIRKILSPWPWSRKPDWIEARSIFAQYLVDGLKVPKYWQSDQAGIQPGAHWSENMIQCLMANLGMTYSESMNMHLPLARRLFLAHMESANGKKILYSQRDEEDARFAQEILERRRNGESKH